MAVSSAKPGTILNKGLVPARRALELVLEDAGPIGIEQLNLAQASNRVLAASLGAKRTQPPFPASAMDGYAVRANDLTGAGTTLISIGEVAAGHPFEGALETGQCVRIFTGAPVPQGADTIIIQENATELNGAVTINQTAPRGKFVRPAGLDFKKGEILLEKGAVLDPQALSLAASMDYPEVEVFARPKIAILATGDELVLPGERTRDGQIIASNTFGVAAIANSAGAEVDNLGIALDTFEDLKSRIETSLDNGTDLIVTIGGASVGDHDLVKPVMERLGFVFSFIKIAMRPGKPVIFGRCVYRGKERRFLGLPGNPVSSLVSSHIFLKPLICLLGGYAPQTVQSVPAVLGTSLPENDEREDYLRGTAKRGSDGSLIVSPFEKQDSSMLATLSRADCLIIRPVRAPAANKGDSVQTILLRNIQ